MSHCETFQPLGAADASAIRTGLRSISLVNLNTHGLPSGRFIPQHVPESRPPCVEHGLRHPCLSETRGIHIADSDQFIFPRQSCASDVEMMFPRIRDLGLNSAGECFEAEIDTDLTTPGWDIVFNFALEGDIPATSCVLDERASLEYSLHFSVVPEAKPSLEVDGCIAVYPNSARDERYPSKGTFGAKASAESRAATVSVARCGKLAADSLNCVGMQPKISGASGAELYQIKCGWPTDSATGFSALFSLTLGRDTKVPYLIASDSVASEMLAADGILDAKFEGENTHFGSVLVASGLIKSASSGCSPSARSHFLPLHNLDNKRLPMSNAELCRRLRWPYGAGSAFVSVPMHMLRDAAEAIEVLEAERDAGNEYIANMRAAIDALTARAEKAEAALAGAVSWMSCVEPHLQDTAQFKSNIADYRAALSSTSKGEDDV